MQPGVTPGAVLELSAARANLGALAPNNAGDHLRWVDLSGYGNHGALSGFDFNSMKTGWSETALRFDGVDDYVALPDVGAAEDKTFTYEAWILTSDASATNRYLISEADTSVATAYAALHLTTAGKLRGYIRDASAGAAAVSSASVNDGTLKHCVATFDGTNVRVYINGSADGADSTEGAVVAPNIAASTVGALKTNATSGYFPGSVALARIYPTALTAGQVAANYAAGPAGTPTSGAVLDLRASKANGTGPRSNREVGTTRWEDTSQRGVNYATNPSFEAGDPPSGYSDIYGSGIKGTVVRSRVAGRLGGYAHRIQYTGVTGDAGSAISIVFETSAASFAPNDPLSYGVWFKLTKSAGVTVTHTTYARTAANTYISQVGGVTISDSSNWARSVSSGVSPALTDRYRWLIIIENIDAGESVDLILDDLMLAKAPYLPDYFDGSYPSCSWTGTAHASTSISPYGVNNGTLTNVGETVTNYLTDPSYEVDSNADGLANDIGYNKNIGTPTPSLVAGRTGGYAQRVAYTAPVGETGSYCDVGLSGMTAPGLFTAGDPVTLSVYLKGSLTGIPLALRMYFYTDAGTYVGYVSGTPVSSLPSSWDGSRFILTSVVPATATRVWGVISMTGIAAGDSFDFTFDDAQLVKRSYPVAYFDGNSGAGCAWTGTANASASTKYQAVTAVNYCTNPSFETDAHTNTLADGWTAAWASDITGTPVYSKVTGRSGGIAQRIQYTGVAGDGAGGTKALYIVIDLTAAGSFAAGDYVTVSAYVKGSVVGCSARLGAWFRDAGGAYVPGGSNTETITLTDSYTRNSMTTAVAPAGTSTLRAGLYIYNISEGDTIDITIDDVVITKTPYATAYFDGSSGTGYSWASTANASVSFSPIVTSGWAGSGTRSDPYRLAMNVPLNSAYIQTAGFAQSSSTFTIELWVTRRPDASARVVLCHGQYWVDGWYLWMSDATHYLALNIAGAGIASGGMVVPTANALEHWVYIIDNVAKTISPYRNNVAQSVVGYSSSIVLPTAARKFTVGNYDAPSTTYGARSEIPAVRYYPFALSAAQVAANYAAGPHWAAPDNLCRTRILGGA